MSHYFRPFGPFRPPASRLGVATVLLAVGVVALGPARLARHLDVAPAAPGAVENAQWTEASGPLAPPVGIVDPASDVHSPRAQSAAPGRESAAERSLCDLSVAPVLPPPLSSSGSIPWQDAGAPSRFLLLISPARGPPPTA